MDLLFIKKLKIKTRQKIWVFFFGLFVITYKGNDEITSK